MDGPDGFVAELSSSGTAHSTLKLWRDHRHPMRGLIFPDYRHAVPRTTAQYTARGRSVNQVATFALDRSRLVRGTLADSSDPNGATVTLRAPGSPPTALRVTRSGAKLKVSAR